jgi:hypothetical protein
LTSSPIIFAFKNANENPRSEKMPTKVHEANGRAEAIQKQQF